MGLIVDIVPNHLGVMGDDNAWWLDVLENGPAARAAHHFDIDWRPNRSSMRDRVLVPMLGDVYGAVLERGELKLQFDPAAGSFSIRYHEHLLPIDPREYPRIFAQTPIPATLLAPDDPHRADFESLLNAFANLPPRSDTSEDSIAIRYRDKEAHKRRLVRLLERSPEIQQHIEATRRAAQRHAGRSAQLRCSRCAARCAGLSAVVLARGGRRDQLPALLRRQRPRGAAHGRGRRVRQHASARSSS